MREMTVSELRATLGRLDELLRQVGEVVITRHGTPVARIVPRPGARERPTHRELRESMPRLQVSSAELLREERDSSPHAAQGGAVEEVLRLSGAAPTRRGEEAWNRDGLHDRS